MKTFFSLISEIPQHLRSSQHAQRIFHLLGLYLEAIRLDNDHKAISKFHESRQVFDELLGREQRDRGGGLQRGTCDHPNPPRLLGVEPEVDDQ